MREFVENTDVQVFNDGDIKISKGLSSEYLIPDNENGFEQVRLLIKRMLPQWEEKGWVLEEFESILSKHGVKLEYYNILLKNISRELERKWVDIEKIYYEEMVLLIGTSEEKNNKIDYLNYDFEEIKKALAKYLKRELKKKVKYNKNIEESIYKGIEFEDITRVEKKNIERSIGKLIPNVYSDDSFPFNDEVMDKGGIYINEEKRWVIRPRKILFLNFNYTPIAERYMDKKRESKVIHIHIHGELKNQGNPIIFGYGDKIDDKYSSIKKMNDNRFFENIKSIKYFETDNHRHLLDFIEDDTYQVCVFGHSCGVSDRTLLNTLFEHTNCVSIKVFYHQRIDGTDNHSDIIRNIIRNSTNEAVVEEKIVNKKCCKPLKGKS
jgi:hypothetical protein